MVVRLESTQSWRQKLWDAHARYQAARTRRRRLEEGQVRNLEHLVALARRVESEALAEYVWLVKIGTALKARRKGLTAIRVVEQVVDGDDSDSHFGG